jgi:arylsulfatase
MIPALILAAAPQPPNIVLIMADDLGYGEIGAYGQTKIETPNLDRLAKEGMMFTDFYSGAPVCAPSRSVLMTGRHSGHSQIRGNKKLKPGYSPAVPEGQVPLEDGTVTMASMLKEAGYATGIVGKWGLGGPHTGSAPNDRGFDWWFGVNCQTMMHTFYPPHVWRNREKIDLGNGWLPIRARLNEVPTHEEYHKDYVGPVYVETVETTRAKEFIRKNQDQPFFLYVATALPHVALQAPEEMLNKYKGRWPETPYLGQRGYTPHRWPRAAYAAMISTLDKQVGELLSTLEEHGLKENTLVLFTSDNGATHDVGGVDTEFFDSVGPLKGRKGSVCEGGIRVPMIARWPGRIEAGSKSELPSAAWDLMATAAEAASANAPKTDGISLMPELTGDPISTDRHLLWEYPEYGGQQAVRWGDWKAVRRNVKRNPDAPVQLYNLAKDLAETTDVAKEHPEIVEKLYQLMVNDRSTNKYPDWEDWVQKGRL